MNIKDLETRLDSLGFKFNYKNGNISGSYNKKSKIAHKINNLVENINKLFVEYNNLHQNEVANSSTELRLELNYHFEDFFNIKLPFIVSYKIKELEMDLFLGNIDEIEEKIKEWKAEYPYYQSMHMNSDYNYYDDVKTRYFLEGKNVESEAQHVIRNRITYKIRTLLKYTNFCSFYQKRKINDKEYNDYLKLKEKYEGINQK